MSRRDGWCIAGCRRGCCCVSWSFGSRISGSNGGCIAGCEGRSI